MTDSERADDQPAPGLEGLKSGGFLSLSEAAARFSLSHSHLKLLARTGRLEAVKVGRNWVTTTTAVEKYLGDEDLRSRSPYKNRRS